MYVKRRVSAHLYEVSLWFVKGSLLSRTWESELAKDDVVNSASVLHVWKTLDSPQQHPETKINSQNWQSVVCYGAVRLDVCVCVTSRVTLVCDISCDACVWRLVWHLCVGSTRCWCCLQRSTARLRSRTSSVTVSSSPREYTTTPLGGSHILVLLSYSLTHACMCYLSVVK